jgi:hypothetical protein
MTPQGEKPSNRHLWLTLTPSKIQGLFSMCCRKEISKNTSGLRESRELSKGYCMWLYNVDWLCPMELCNEQSIYATVHDKPPLSPSSRSMNPTCICLILTIIDIILFRVNDFQREYENASTQQEHINQLTIVIVNKAEMEKNRHFWVCYSSIAMLSGLWVDFCVIIPTSFSWSEHGLPPL